MRAVFRGLVSTTDQLWHKSSNQSLFKPEDIHMTHLFLYAVGPEYVHQHHSTMDCEKVGVKEDGWICDDNKLTSAP